MQLLGWSNILVVINAITRSSTFLSSNWWNQRQTTASIKRKKGSETRTLLRKWRAAIRLIRSFDYDIQSGRFRHLVAPSLASHSTFQASSHLNHIWRLSNVTAQINICCIHFIFQKYTVDTFSMQDPPFKIRAKKIKKCNPLKINQT